MATWKLVMGTTSQLMYISIDVITDVVNKVLLKKKVGLLKDIQLPRAL
jgi:hypothetical protein